MPANAAPISKENISAFFNFSGTSPLFISLANPNVIAVFPTPGSPTCIGLFLFLLHNIQLLHQHLT